MQGNIIDLKNFILQENGHITCCVSEVLIPRDYKTKEEWFAKVRSVWKETYMQMENSTEEKEIIAPLPGVNTDLCEDEKISRSALVYSFCTIVAISAVLYALCTMCPVSNKRLNTSQTRDTGGPCSPSAGSSRCSTAGRSRSSASSAAGTARSETRSSTPPSPPFPQM